MRKKKIIVNLIFSFINRIVVTICGLILPQIILVFYGSKINGLISSLTQFLGLISFMDLGVGAVIQSALYKPLAERNYETISHIIISGRKFFRNIAKISLIYVLILFVFYDKLTHSEFGFWFSGSLIIILAINSFSEYYFGIMNQLLLNADQKGYICQLTISLTQIINTLICVFLIYKGQSIQLVKLVTAIVFLIRPVVYSFFVKRNYPIKYTTAIKGDVLTQKWNGFAQHVSAVVVDKTDIVILTFFSSLTNVSIYSVYYLVIKNVEQVIYSANTGVQSAIGDIIAYQDRQLNKKFHKIEVVMHLGITSLCSVCVIMLIPFIRIYTKDVTDAYYISYAFGILMSMVCYINCIRNLYHMVIKAAGHFKQTQKCAIIEAIINLSISTLLVIKMGLMGVAIGTIIAGIYRVIYFITYLKKEILYRAPKEFFKFILSDSIPMILSGVVAIYYSDIFVLSNYIQWFIWAIAVFIIFSLLSFVISMAVFFAEWRRIFQE